MKFVFISDLHLHWDNPVGRLDDAKQTQYDKFKELLEWAYRNNASILCAADFFHTPRNWTTLENYAYLLKSWDVKIYTIFGQHDTYMYSEETRGRTNLGILYRAGLVNILNNKYPAFIDGYSIYGCSYGEEIPKPDPGDKNILVIHKMIVKKELWKGQENYESASNFLDKHLDFDIIICGDAHQHFLFYNKTKSRFICNSGPLLRREASEAMFCHSPGFFAFDTEKAKLVWHSLSSRPSEEVLSREHIEVREERNQNLEKFIGSIQSGNLQLGVSFQENLKKFIKENKISKSIQDIIAQAMEDK